MDRISVNIPSLAAVPFLSLTLKQAGERTVWHRLRALVCYIADWEGAPGFENHSWQANLKRTSNIPHLWTCLSAGQGYLKGIRAGACQSCMPETTVWVTMDWPISRYKSSHCCHYKTNLKNAPERTGSWRNYQDQGLRNISPGISHQIPLCRCALHMDACWWKALVYHPAGRGTFL